MGTQQEVNTGYTEKSLMARSLLEQSLHLLIRATADLARYCEHVEHNEPHSVADALSAGERIRSIAATLSATSDISLATIYAARIRMVEEKSPMRHVSRRHGSVDLSGADVIDAARTWRELQIGQLIHDRQFHPDVFGLSKIDQIRHYTLHMAKLAGCFVEALDNDTWDMFQHNHLADVAIFGVKIATVCNSELPELSVDAEKAGNEEAVELSAA